MKLTVLVVALAALFALFIKVYPHKISMAEPIVATKADGSVRCLNRAACGF